MILVFTMEQLFHELETLKQENKKLYADIDMLEKRVEGLQEENLLLAVKDQEPRKETLYDVKDMVQQESDAAVKQAAQTMLKELEWKRRAEGKTSF